MIKRAVFCTICHITLDGILGNHPLVAAMLSAMGSPILLCVFGGQLLINMKEAGERSANGSTNSTTRTISDIEFGEVSLYLHVPNLSLLIRCSPE